MSLTKTEVIEILKNLKVYEKPVLDSNGSDTVVIDGYKSIRLERNDDLVRIVSSEYNTVQHIDAFSQTVADLEKLNVNYIIRQMTINDISALNNKRHNAFHVTFEFPELSFDIDGSKINATLELMNSNDTSLMFTRKFGAYRSSGSCNMSTGKQLFHERFKHVGENSFGNMAEAIEKLPDFLRIFGKVIAKTMLVRTDNIITRGLIELGFPPRLIENLDIASEKYNGLIVEKASPDLLWGTYKILTNWLSNVIAPKNIKRADNLGDALYRFIKFKTLGI